MYLIWTGLIVTANDANGDAAVDILVHCVIMANDALFIPLARTLYVHSK